jgi:hypothetical protein
MCPNPPTHGRANMTGVTEFQAQDKEAGPAGGESGARAHGPALGGEAGSVLIGKLIRIGLWYATTGVVSTTRVVSTQVPSCSVSQSNYNICHSA